MKRASILCLSAAAMVIAAAIPGVSHGALINRGNGTIYDSDLNISWLQDADYAKTSGYTSTYYDRPDGYMNWYEANAWATNLVFAGYDDWRLPTAGGGSGYNINVGELGHLYYDELKGTAGALASVSPFINFTGG